MPKNQCVIDVRYNINLDAVKHLVKYVWVVGRRVTLRRCARVEAKAIGHIDKIGVPEE